MIANFRRWSLLVVLVPALVAARQPTRSDRFWAYYEGFEIEAYLAMKDLGKTMTALQEEGSIARRNDDSAAQSWLKEQVGDKLVDWANDINPAVKPIKTMSDFAQQKTQAWLDWSFRSKFNTMYREYQRTLRETGDVKQAADAVNRLLDELLAVNMNAKDQKMLQVLKQHRGVVLAQLIKTDSELHPDTYAGKDIGKALRGGKAQPPGDTGATPPELQALTPERQKALLDCLCKCGSDANLSMVSVSWNPKPDNHSPGCADTSGGPCINKGYGCWRTSPASGGQCADACARKAGLRSVPVLGKP